LARRTIPRGAASERWDPCARRAPPGGVADTPRTTRDVTPADVADVVTDPRRATVTFVDNGEPAIVPVRARREGDRWRFAAAAPALDDREVVLLLDAGDWWFELRGVSVRGVARRDGDGWYTVEPRRILAWSYGSLPLPPLCPPRPRLPRRVAGRRACHRPPLRPSVRHAALVRLRRRRTLRHHGGDQPCRPKCRAAPCRRNAAPRRSRWAPRPGPPAARVGDRAPRVPELARAREARAQVPLESARRALRTAARRTVAAASPLLCRRARGPCAPPDRP